MKEHALRIGVQLLGKLLAVCYAAVPRHHLQHLARRDGQGAQAGKVCLVACRATCQVLAGRPASFAQASACLHRHSSASPPGLRPTRLACTMQHGSFLLLTSLPASCFFRSFASNLVDMYRLPAEGTGLRGRSGQSCLVHGAGLCRATIAGAVPWHCPSTAWANPRVMRRWNLLPACGPLGKSSCGGRGGTSCLRGWAGSRTTGSLSPAAACPAAPRPSPPG